MLSGLCRLAPAAERIGVGTRNYKYCRAPAIQISLTYFQAALRIQRATYDLLGIAAEGADSRGWFRHGGWPENSFPLRREVNTSQSYPLESKPYPFVAVEGDGVHEIAVGPVHAGIIEPGHFRFSVVGEKVLRLEERLGYTHKGVANDLSRYRNSRATGWRRACPATLPWRFPGHTARRSNPSPPHPALRVPSRCAHWRWSMSGSPIISATWEHLETMPDSPLASCNSRASKKTSSAPTRTPLAHAT